MMKRLLAAIALACASLLPRIAAADQRVTWYTAENPTSNKQLLSERYQRITAGTDRYSIWGGPGYANLSVLPSSGLNVTIGPANSSVQGAVYVLIPDDSTAWGGGPEGGSQLPADSTEILGQGLIASTSSALGPLAAPSVAGQSQISLIECTIATQDENPVQTIFTDSGSGAKTALSVDRDRVDTVSCQAKAGTASTSPVAPATDSAYVGIATVTIPYGASSVTTGMITMNTVIGYSATLPSQLATPQTTAQATFPGSLTYTFNGQVTATQFNGAGSFSTATAGGLNATTYANVNGSIAGGSVPALGIGTAGTDTTYGVLIGSNISGTTKETDITAESGVSVNGVAGGLLIVGQPGVAPELALSTSGNLGVAGSGSFAGGVSTTTGAFSGVVSSTAGGDAIQLNNATSNDIAFSANGLGSPSFSARSVGTKIALFPDISGSTVDYAIGVNTNTLWESVPTTASYFSWYGGTTTAATLTGAGALTLTAGLTATTGSFTTATAGGLNATTYANVNGSIANGSVAALGIGTAGTDTTYGVLIGSNLASGIKETNLTAANGTTVNGVAGGLLLVSQPGGAAQLALSGTGSLGLVGGATLGGTIKAASVASGTQSYVAPIYSTSGASVPSTFHGIQYACAFSAGTTCNVTLTGTSTGTFTSATSYSCGSPDMGTSTTPIAFVVGNKTATSFTVYALTSNSDTVNGTCWGS